MAKVFHLCVILILAAQVILTRQTFNPVQLCKKFCWAVAVKVVGSKSGSGSDKKVKTDRQWVHWEIL